jgi:hypothetical protein
MFFQGLAESRPLDRFSMGGVEFSVTERRLAVARGPVMRGAAELQCVGSLCQGVEVGFEFSQLPFVERSWLGRRLPCARRP